MCVVILKFSVRKQIFAAFVFTFILKSVHLQKECTDINFNKKLFNRRLVGFNITTLTEESIGTCVGKCFLLTHCLSTNFDIGSKQCDLNNITSDEMPTAVVERGGSVLMDLASFPKAMAGPCGDKPCNGRDICLPAGESFLCHTSDCETLPLIPNGHVIYPSGIIVGAKAVYTCNDGSIIRGDNERKCLLTRNWDGVSPVCIPVHNCKEVLDAGLSTGDGLYNITVNENGTDVAIEVFCDMTTDQGGWTVFQYRFNGSVEFYRDYNEYTEGFGLYPGEFWLGLRWVHAITARDVSMIRVDLVAKDPLGDGQVTGFAKYKTFSIGPAAEGYKLHVDGYLQNSTLKDMLTWHNGLGFTTKDHDVDGIGDNCAVSFHGAWWYKNGYESNLNGLYLEPGVDDDTSMNWKGWPTWAFKSLVASQLSFKPV